MIKEAMTETVKRLAVLATVFQEKGAKTRLPALPGLSGGTAEDIFEAVKAVIQ